MIYVDEFFAVEGHSDADAVAETEFEDVGVGRGEVDDLIVLLAYCVSDVVLCGLDRLNDCGGLDGWIGSIPAIISPSTS